MAVASKRGSGVTRSDLLLPFPGKPARLAVALLSCVTLFVAPAAKASPDGPPTAAPSPIECYGDDIAEAAQRFEIPATWIRAVMRAESAGDVRSVSPRGAMGLMQIMPETWAELRVQFQLGDDPLNAHANILAGAAYLRQLHDRYGSPGFLAAYNAGPGRYEEYLAGRPLPDETLAYVALLSPIIGSGDAAASSVVARPRAVTWIEAPLFAVRPDRTPNVDPAVLESHADSLSAMVPTRDSSAMKARSDGLFATRSGLGGPQ